MTLPTKIGNLETREIMGNSKITIEVTIKIPRRAKNRGKNKRMRKRKIKEIKTPSFFWHFE